MFCIQIEDDLYMQLIEMHDIADLYAEVNRSRRHLRRWLPWVDSMRTMLDYEPVVRTWLQQFANGRGFQAGIRKNGHFAGMVGFHDIDWVGKKTTVGYWLGDRFTGQGIMTKAVDACLTVAFEKYALNRVEILCGINNLGSQAIPHRLGFQKEGIVRDGEWLYDHYHDLVQYSLLRREWQRYRER